jgi:hypothetical protein
MNLCAGAQCAAGVLSRAHGIVGREVTSQAALAGAAFAELESAAAASDKGPGDTISQGMLLQCMQYMAASRPCHVTSA